MTLKIGEYIVTVKAELDPVKCGPAALLAPKEPEEHTKDFLNSLACAFVDAAAWNRQQGYKFTGDEYFAKKSAIYAALDATGYYDDVREKLSKREA